MTALISHTKTNTIPDWTQADLDVQISRGFFPVGTTLSKIVLPSDWNNDHDVSGFLANANTWTGKQTFSTNASGVYVDIAGPTITTGNNTFGQLNIRSTDAVAANMGGSITFSGVVDGSGNVRNFAAIEGKREASGQQGYLKFSVNNASVWTEAMRIISTGLVGIGTTTPQTALSFPSASTGISLYNTADMTTNYEQGLISWSGNVLKLGMSKGGSGTARDVAIGSPLASITVKGVLGSGPGIDYDVASSSAATWVAFRFGTGTMSTGASSGIFTNAVMQPTISNDTGSHGYTVLRLNAIETNLAGSGLRYLLHLQNTNVDKFTVNSVGAVIAAGSVTATSFIPSSPQTYTITNVTTDRAYDANSTTLDEIADTLGTLIADLRTAGLVL